MAEAKQKTRTSLSNYGRFVEKRSNWPLTKSQKLVAAISADMSAVLKRDGDVVLSLDLFDTVFLRNSKSELRRFWEIARKQSGIDELAGRRVTEVDLFWARVKAWRHAYRTAPGPSARKEASLEQIYGSVVKYLDLDPQSQESLIACELEYERENLTVSPLLSIFIDILGSRLKRLVATTDMYLGEAQIQVLLEKFGIATRFDEILSSGDLKLSKRDGTIYPYLKEKYGNHVVHAGDNYESDYAIPTAQGIPSIHLAVPPSEMARRKQDERDFETELRKLHMIAP